MPDIITSSVDPMLFVAQDICDGETCDCIMSGKISEVSDALASACVVAPSLAAAVVACAEAGDVGPIHR